MTNSVLIPALIALAFGTTDGPDVQTFHLIDIQEVYTNADGSIQFVELIARSNFQTNLSETHIIAKNFDNSITQTVFDFTADFPALNVNETVLVATPDFEEAAGFAPDFVMPAGSLIFFVDGRVIFESDNGVTLVDSVAYGNYTADNTGFGLPAAALPCDGTNSLTRLTTGNNNAANFSVQVNSPKRNDGMMTTLDPTITTDCNTNDSEDSCDLVSGASFDCNTNDVPDECDLGGGLEDCDTNTVPDECDFIAGAPPEGFALDFDGVDDFVEAGSDASLRITGDLTVEAWVKIDEIVIRRIVGFGASGETQATNFLYQLELRLTGDIRAFHETSTSGDVIATFNTDLKPGRWYHLAEVRNTGNSKYRLYVDGVLFSPVTYVGQPAGGASGVLRIGTNETNSNAFNGTIDEVRIWNIARSQAAIQSTMFTTLTGDEAGLVAYWKLDEGDGTVANDSDNAGVNDGNLMNGVSWTGVADPADCNSNGAPDVCDVGLGESDDANGNGVPDECECVLPGDVNGDAVIDGDDIKHFVECLLTGSSEGGTCQCADLNGDGVVDDADVGLMAAALLP